MPIRVEVEGQPDLFEFPDGTTDDVIGETIRRETGGAAPSLQPTFQQGASAPAPTQLQEPIFGAQEPQGLLEQFTRGIGTGIAQLPADLLANPDIFFGTNEVTDFIRERVGVPFQTFVRSQAPFNLAPDPLEVYKDEGLLAAIGSAFNPENLASGLGQGVGSLLSIAAGGGVGGLAVKGAGKAALAVGAKAGIKRTAKTVTKEAARKAARDRRFVTIAGVQGGIMEGFGAVEEAREQGADLGQRRTVFAATSLGSAVLNSIGFAGLTNKLPVSFKTGLGTAALAAVNKLPSGLRTDAAKAVATKGFTVATGGVLEGVTEYLEGPVAAAAFEIAGLDGELQDRLISGIQDAVVGGILGSASSAIFGEPVTSLDDKRVKDFDPPAFKLEEGIKRRLINTFNIRPEQENAFTEIAQRFFATLAGVNGFEPADFVARFIEARDKGEVPGLGKEGQILEQAPTEEGLLTDVQDPRLDARIGTPEQATPGGNNYQNHFLVEPTKEEIQSGTVRSHSLGSVIQSYLTTAEGVSLDTPPKALAFLKTSDRIIEGKKFLMIEEMGRFGTTSKALKEGFASAMLKRALSLAAEDPTIKTGFLRSKYEGLAIVNGAEVVEHSQRLRSSGGKEKAREFYNKELPALLSKQVKERGLLDKEVREGTLEGLPDDRREALNKVQLLELNDFDRGKIRSQGSLILQQEGEGKSQVLKQAPTAQGFRLRTPEVLEEMQAGPVPGRIGKRGITKEALRIKLKKASPAVRDEEIRSLDLDAMFKDAKGGRLSAAEIEAKIEESSVLNTATLQEVTQGTLPPAMLEGFQREAEELGFIIRQDPASLAQPRIVQSQYSDSLITASGFLVGGLVEDPVPLEQATNYIPRTPEQIQFHKLLIRLLLAVEPPNNNFEGDQFNAPGPKESQQNYFLAGPVDKEAKHFSGGYTLGQNLRQFTNFPIWVWARTSVRMIDGLRTLLVEEIQSDQEQALRREEKAQKNYQAQKERDINEQRGIITRSVSPFAIARAQARIKELEDLVTLSFWDKRKKATSRVPSSYNSVMLKRLLSIVANDPDLEGLAIINGHEAWRHSDYHGADVDAALEDDVDAALEGEPTAKGNVDAYDVVLPGDLQGVLKQAKLPREVGRGRIDSGRKGVTLQLVHGVPQIQAQPRLRGGKRETDTAVTLEDKAYDLDMVRTYYPSEEAQETIREKGFLFFQEEEGKSKGQLRITPGKDGTRFLFQGLTNPDISSAFHELAHFAALSATGEFKKQIEQAAYNAGYYNKRGLKGVPLTIEEWNTARPGEDKIKTGPVRSTLGDARPIPRGVDEAFLEDGTPLGFPHEKFARDFERFLIQQDAPTKELEPLFAEIKDYMRDIYEGTIGEDSLMGRAISPEMKQIFDFILKPPVIGKRAVEEIASFHKRSMAEIQKAIRKAEVEEVGNVILSRAGLSAEEVAAEVVRRQQLMPLGTPEGFLEQREGESLEDYGDRLLEFENTFELTQDLLKEQLDTSDAAVVKPTRAEVQRVLPDLYGGFSGAEFQNLLTKKEARQAVDLGFAALLEAQRGDALEGTATKIRKDLLPEGWPVVVGRTRTKEGHTSEGEVDWQNKRIVVSEDDHTKNPEIINHEIAHVIFETHKDMEGVEAGYIKAKENTPKWKEYGKDWIVKNNFHGEEIAIDLTEYIQGREVSPELESLFDKFFPRIKGGTVTKGPDSDFTMEQKDLPKAGGGSIHDPYGVLPEMKEEKEKEKDLVAGPQYLYRDTASSALTTAIQRLTLKIAKKNLIMAQKRGVTTDEKLLDDAANVLGDRKRMEELRTQKYSMVNNARELAALGFAEAFDYRVIQAIMETDLSYNKKKELLESHTGKYSDAFSLGGSDAGLTLRALKVVHQHIDNQNFLEELDALPNMTPEDWQEFDRVGASVEKFEKFYRRIYLEDKVGAKKLGKKEFLRQKRRHSLVLSLYYNFILSGKSIAVNLIGTQLMGIELIANRLILGVVESIRTKMNKIRGVEGLPAQAVPTEALSLLAAHMRGTISAVSLGTLTFPSLRAGRKAFIQAIKGEIDVTREELNDPNAVYTNIETEMQGLRYVIGDHLRAALPESPNAANKLALIFEYPTRFMEATDLWFKGIAEDGQRNALLRRREAFLKKAVAMEESASTKEEKEAAKREKDRANGLFAMSVIQEISTKPTRNQPEFATPVLKVIQRAVKASANGDTEGAATLFAKVENEMIEGLLRTEFMRFAEHSTLQDAPGSTTRRIKKQRDRGGLILRMFIPFINTIANITKRSGELVPIVGIGFGKVWGDKLSNSEVVAKQIEGLFLALVLSTMFDDEDLIGEAPRSPAERDAWRRQGKKPYTMRIGNSDTFVDYRNLEPFGSVMASVASFRARYQDFNESREGDPTKDEQTVFDLFLGTLLDASREILNTTFLSSPLEAVGDVIGSKTDQPISIRLKRELIRPAAAMLPFSSLIRTAGNAISAETTGLVPSLEGDSWPQLMGQAFPLGLPAALGLSDLLQQTPRRGSFGQVQSRKSGLFKEWFNLSDRVGLEDDFVEQELQALGHYPGSPLPSQVITVGSGLGAIAVKVPDDMYTSYLIDYGIEAKGRLDRLYRSVSYQRQGRVRRSILSERILRRIQEKHRKRLASQVVRSRLHLSSEHGISRVQQRGLAANRNL